MDCFDRSFSVDPVDDCRTDAPQDEERSGCDYWARLRDGSGFRGAAAEPPERSAALVGAVASSPDDSGSAGAPAGSPEDELFVQVLYLVSLPDDRFQASCSGFAAAAAPVLVRADCLAAVLRDCFPAADCFPVALPDCSRAVQDGSLPHPDVSRGFPAIPDVVLHSVWLHPDDCSQLRRGGFPGHQDEEQHGCSPDGCSPDGYSLDDCFPDDFPERLDEEQHWDCCPDDSRCLQDAARLHSWPPPGGHFLLHRVQEVEPERAVPL